MCDCKLLTHPLPPQHRDAPKACRVCGEKHEPVAYPSNPILDPIQSRRDYGDR